jgi:hypothetical protein
MRAIFALVVLAAFSSVPDAVVSPSFAEAPAGDFVPGSRELYSADFSQFPPGAFTATLKGLKYLRGTMQVTDQDGMQVLQSSSPSEFLINLPEKLPDSFTLEFDIIPRGTDCCAGEELAFEGTPTINRSTGSANVLWHHQYLAILGGGKDMGNSTVKLPEDLQGELLGQLSEVRVSVSGTNFKLWTNGRLLYDLPNLPFVRGRVIRVFLGGTDVSDRTVSLARVRVAANSVAAGAASTTSSASAATVGSGVTTTGTPLSAVTGTGRIGTVGSLPSTATVQTPTATAPVLATSSPATPVAQTIAPTTASTTPTLLDAAGPTATTTPTTNVPTGVSVILLDLRKVYQPPWPGPVANISWVGVPREDPTAPDRTFSYYLLEWWPSDAPDACGTNPKTSPGSDSRCHRRLAFESPTQEYEIEVGQNYMFRVSAVYHEVAYPSAPAALTVPMVDPKMYGPRTLHAVPRLNLKATFGDVQDDFWATKPPYKVRDMVLSWDAFPDADAYSYSLRTVSSSGDLLYPFLQDVVNHATEVMLKVDAAAVPILVCVGPNLLTLDALAYVDPDGIGTECKTFTPP